MAWAARDGSAAPRQDGPGLGDGVDAALVALGGAEPGAVVEGRAPVPAAVPGSRLLRRSQRLGMGAPAPGAIRIAGVGEGREDRDGAQEQPAEPDALALAALADPVHAVVPVAGADQRQAVGAGQLEALVEAAGAMLEQRGGVLGLHRLEEGVVLAGREGRAVEERHDLVQHGASPVAVT
jgi:hypothetical protein